MSAVPAIRPLDAEQWYLAALVHSSDDAIIGKTLQGVITSWNAAATRLFGYAADEVIGRSMSLLVPADRQNEEPIILDRLSRGERVAHVDTVRRRKDGSEVQVSFTSSPVRDMSGVLIGASQVVRDNTERHQAAEDLRRAKGEEAEASNRELEAFSYSVAHDLRAPLRGMNGFAQMLVEDYGDKLDPQGHEWLQEILLNARKMATLVDALLSLAQLTRAELRYEPVDLSRMVRAVVEQLADRERDRAVAIVVEDGIIEDLDPVLARALVENLVGNAWKFTSKTPNARIELGTTHAHGTRTIFIRDNGAGFDMAYADKLFGPFQRLHSVAEFAGTGIGLATVQRIVRRHGGCITATGTVGAGATFSFSFPDRSGEGR